MTSKHTLWTALFLPLLGLGLAGCPSSANDGSNVTFTPTPFSGTGGAVVTGGVLGTTGGVLGTTGGVVGATGGEITGSGGFLVTGGVATGSGGFLVTGGVVTGSGGFGLTGGTTGGVIGSTGGFTATGGMAPETGGMAPETGGTVTGATVSKATFTVTTKSQGGRYSPRNVAAIWVEDASGNFVKALAKHAFQRATYLRAFNSAAGIFPNLTDAVTSATLSRHQEHTVTWNLTNDAGSPMPPGDYKFRIEVTEKDAAGNNISVNFSTANGPGTTNPPDEQYYVGMSIVLQ